MIDWDKVQKSAEDVAKWPAWKKGSPINESSSEHRQTIAYDAKGNVLDESIKPGTDAQHPEIIPVGLPTNDYKVKEVYQDIWAVEFVWQMPARTTKYVAVFYGDISKERATEYADWKNRT